MRKIKIEKKHNLSERQDESDVRHPLWGCRGLGRAISGREHKVHHFFVRICVAIDRTPEYFFVTNNIFGRVALWI